MKVRKLPVNPGPAAWNALLPSRSAAAALRRAITADWLIVGAGFAGLAAARRLHALCPDDKVVIAEAHTVAEGPAGRNSGFMIDLPHDLSSEDYGGSLEKDRAQTALNRQAIAFAAEAVAEYGLGAEAFAPRGKVNGAASERGMARNHAYARHLDALGEPYRMLDATEMRNLTGSDYYLGGLYTGGTVMLQPALFIRGLADGLVSNGVALYENSPVVELSSTDGVWLAQTPGGSVSAARVILAVNGHAESFGLYRRRLMHVFTYASMTEALSARALRSLGGERCWGLTPADPLGTTVRRFCGTGGERIVIRNRFTYDPAMQVDRQRIARVARQHDRAFARRFPMLRGVVMAYRWGGQLCLSRNGVQLVGEVEPGLFVAICQNGLGTVRGTLGGMMVADLATQSCSGLWAKTVPLEQPRRLPPEPLAWIGANAVLRWGEMRAGREF